MPTFKLEEMDDDVPYGGDNDMYFRQWRLPSMKPILDEKWAFSSKKRLKTRGFFADWTEIFRIR